MPFNNEPFNHHLYCVVPGILSYYNFCNTGPDFLLKTRIFSDQKKFLHSIEFKLESKPYDSTQATEKTETTLTNKIKNCKFIKRKRLFVDMIERKANESLTPQSNVYYKKTNPDLAHIPQFCKVNKKSPCITCNSRCLFTEAAIRDDITPIELKKELKNHFHPQTRKDKSFEDMKQELINHYKFTHQNFGENSENKKLYCICQKEEEENGDFWVMCGMEEECENQWFHINCMKELDYALPKDLDDIGNFISYNITLNDFLRKYLVGNLLKSDVKEVFKCFEENFKFK